MPGKDSCSCTLIDRFSFTQKLSMRAGWFGFMAVGTYAIAKQNPLWAWAYVAFGFFGFALVVLPSICAHCPYVRQRGLIGVLSRVTLFDCFEHLALEHVGGA